MSGGLLTEGGREGGREGGKANNLYNYICISEYNFRLIIIIVSSIKYQDNVAVDTILIRNAR